MISVISTLFNYRNYIGECIESFLKQKNTDAEMIIVDDCSTDNPYKTIKKYVQINSNIIYTKLDVNSGYSKAKNIGIKMARGDTIVMLDADDMLTKNSLKIRYDKLQEGYDLVHGPALDLKNGSTVKSSLWPKWMASKKDASCYKFIHAQSVMLKKSIHREIGLYDEQLRFKSDREMWARVMNHQYKIGVVSEPVCIYRIHEKQMHKSKAKALINEQLELDVQQRIQRRAQSLDDVEMLV